LVSDLSFAKKNMNINKLEDLNSDSIKFMTIDKFNDEIKGKAINLIPENLKMFFDFAKFARSKKAYLTAEKFYKIVLKYQYNIDKCYLALGEIYNKLGKAELSFYCYENAFCENLMLAREILSKDHVNYNYVFSKKIENCVTKCPICGEETKHINTYLNLQDASLTYNDSMIVKYRECQNCSHIFAENDVKDKIYWTKESLGKLNKDRISVSYNILESLSEITDDDRILELDFDNGEFESAATNYGFEVIHDSYGEKFHNRFLSTIFIGGGTPSWLHERLMEEIFSAVYRNFEVSRDAEITIVSLEPICTLLNSPLAIRVSALIGSP